MIPNIAHFIWFDQQKEDFLFVYYVAVLSCKVVNNPDKIYFYYHHEPKGKWWQKTKEICEIVYVDVPTHIGSKELKKIAHKADALRMTKLKEIGGVYLDMDTICVKSYVHLLQNKFVIANEITESGKNMGLCNAIMMSEPNGSFIVDWLNQYEAHFEPDGWQEASTILPWKLSKEDDKHTNNITILKPENFLLPSWEKVDMIFERPNEISDELIVLHYWNQYTNEKYLKHITNFDWIVDHSDTLYAKLLLNVLQNAVTNMSHMNHREDHQQITTTQAVTQAAAATTTKVSSNPGNPENLGDVSVLILLSTKDGQHKVNLKKVNEYYKRVTNSKIFNITENYSDFLNAFKSCTSIGSCSILTQVVTNCYILYNNTKDIIRDREYHKKMIQFMIEKVGKIFNNINDLHSFINYNNSYMYCYQNMSNVEIYKLISQLQIKLCPDLLFNSLTAAAANKNVKLDSSLKKKIKVGFISDHLSTFHSVSKDRLGIIKHLHNDSDFDVTIMIRKMMSPFSNKIIYGKDALDNNVDTTNSNMMKVIIMDENDLVANRNQIANEHFDIIVYPEIGMCQKNRYIAYARLAPIQINTWGHSDTSGLPNIDYFVSSKYFNSPEDQYQYSEKLILFDSLGTYYYNVFNYFKESIHLHDSEDDNKNFRKKISEITGVKNPNIYGCIQIFIKMHPTFVNMLDKILKTDENGVLVILSSDKGDNEDDIFKNYINRKIKNNDRIYFIHQAPFIEYTNNVKNCDIILDYYPFGGLNSVIESFLLGKVCITLPGARISGKFTQGLYKKMGITEFICNTEDEYVSKSVDYAKDVKKRKKYEKCILDNVHKILEEKESVDEWKMFLKKCFESLH